MRRLVIRSLLPLLAFVCAGPADAHPVPFSYLDLRIGEVPGVVSGALVVHDFDVSYELGLISDASLLDQKWAESYRAELIRILGPRVRLAFDGKEAAIEWGAVTAIPERQSLRFDFTVRVASPVRVLVHAEMFPYDPVHQTFLNIYENGALAKQAILDAQHADVSHYSGSTQSLLTVVKTFVISGVEHILIGPDHVLFLIGLLLLRGSIARLALIVTAFTLGHSVTLSLAALDIVSPPSRLIEPLIALTIVVVGVDNLLVLRESNEKKKTATDIRALLAGGFGLIHGFGFASVLKEFGLPSVALGWSLFAFNVGVEVGQLMIVTVVATVLTLLVRRNAALEARLAMGGSIAVILAGLYWFVERTFLTGGQS